MRFGIGQPITRKEDRRFLCGQGQFVADIDLARQTQAVFVYSPHAHGRILAVDTAAAEQAPGVRAVLTGAGWASAGMGCFEPEFMVEDVGGPKAVRTKIWPLALDRVRYVGERVAVVIADTEAQARDAAELVSVNYEVLPAIVDVANATRPDAPLVHDGITGNVSFTMSAGDAAATAQAFARAHHVTRLTLRNNRVTAFSMEPRGCVADFDRGTGRYTLYTSTQTVHGVRQTLARQIQQFRVHQHCTDDAVPRRRTTRGNLYHRAAGRSGGARASLRPGRTAAPESGSTRRVSVSDENRVGL